MEETEPVTYTVDGSNMHVIDDDLDAVYGDAVVFKDGAYYTSEDVVGEYVNLSNNLPSNLSQRFSSLQTKPTCGRQKPELFCVTHPSTETTIPIVEVSQFINVPQTNSASLQFVVVGVSVENVVTAFCTSNGFIHEIDTTKYVIEPLAEKYAVQSHDVKRMCMVELQRIRNIPEDITTEEMRDEIVENDEKFRKLIMLYKRMYVGEELMYSLKLSHLAIILEGHRKSYLTELIEKLESELDI
jgi:hypothetical protein